MSGWAVNSLLSAPGMSEALSELAGQLAVAILNGADVAALLPGALQGLLGQSAVQNALDGTVAGAVSLLLGNAGLVGAVGTTLTGLLSGALTDPALEDLIGQQVVALVGVLGDTPAATDIGVAVAGALIELLAAPAFSDGFCGRGRHCLDHLPRPARDRRGSRRHRGQSRPGGAHRRRSCRSPCRARCPHWKRTRTSSRRWGSPLPLRSTFSTSNC